MSFTPNQILGLVALAYLFGILVGAGVGIALAAPKGRLVP